MAGVPTGTRHGLGPTPSAEALGYWRAFLRN